MKELPKPISSFNIHSMEIPSSVKTLENLGRVQLSSSFFMRDFLYSEISQIEGIPNIPVDPKLAIETGGNLCNKVLEPIQKKLGRICILSGYRSPAVNAKGAENNNQYNCSSNERNYAKHIWDIPNEEKDIGAVACIVISSFLPYYEATGDWQALAWWIHDNIPSYSSMYFFPKLAAFNIGRHQAPTRTISSHIPPKGCLTKPGMPNHEGDHSQHYLKFIESIKL